MSFARAKREFYIDKELKSRANLPGPTDYKTDTKWGTNGFKYHDLTASTICELSTMGRTMLDRSCDDIDLHKRGSSTPLKRNPLSSSVRGRKTGSQSARKLNMDKTQNSVSNEVLKLKQELQVREQKYLEVFSDREALKETVMTLKDLAKDLEQTMKAKDNAFKDKCGVIEKLEQKIQEFESQMKDQLSEIERLEGKLREMTEKNEISYKQNLLLEDQKLSYMKQIESEQKKYTDLEASYDEKEKILQEKAKVAEQSQLEIYNMQQDKVANEQKLKEAMQDQLEECRQQYELHLSERTVQIKQLEDSIDQLESSKKTQKLEIDRNRAEIESLLNAQGHQNGLVDSYKEAISKLEEKNDQLKNEATKTATDHTEKVLELEGLMQNLKVDSEQRNKELENILQEREQKIRENEENMKAATERSEKLEAEAIAKQEEMLKLSEELQAKIRSNDAEVAKQQADFENQIKRLTNRTSQLESELTSKDKAMQATEERFTALKTKFQKASEAGKYYQEKSGKQSKIIEEQTNTIELLKKESLEKKADQGELDKLNAQIAKEKATNQSANEKIQSLMAELSSLRAEKAQERVSKEALNKLRYELESSEIQMATLKMSEEHWKARFEELNQYVTPFRQDLAKYAEEAHHMHGENSKKAKELEELHSQLATNMGHQNQKQKIKYMTKIKKELQETKEKLSGRECDLKKAKRQIEALTDDINALKGIKRFDPKKAFQQT